MKENLVEMQPLQGAQGLAEMIGNEPTVEVVGSVRELAQRKHWFNEGPGRLDI